MNVHKYLIKVYNKNYNDMLKSIPTDGGNQS